MKQKSKSTILYSLLSVTSIIAIFFIFRSAALQKQLNQIEPQDNLDQGLGANVFLTRLVASDSLFFDENYSDARLAYEQLLKEVRNHEEYKNMLRLRISNLRKAMNMREKLRLLTSEEPNLELSAQSQQIDSLSKELVKSEQLKIDQLDSLSFALEKANMRATSLKKQLAIKSQKGYLKFMTQKGVEVHYVGEMDEGKANGMGVGLYSNGNRYEGQWKDNLHHGEGILFWSDGEYYQGEFQLGKRNGEGKYYWPNGEKFTGEWKNDQRNGEGIFYGKDGETVASGTWKNNKLVERNNN